MPEGIFKCGKHEYATDSIEDWQKHYADEVHQHIGKAPCNQCGISSEFNFTGKVGNKVPALCSDCKATILGGTE